MKPPIDHKVYRCEPSLAPCASVKAGEIFKVHVQNAFGKTFLSVDEFESFLSPENAEEKNRLNHPCTGPIEILTDRTNISLAVHILDFNVSKGFQCLSHSTGVCRERLTKRECMIYDVGPDKIFHFHGNDLRMRSSPKVGFMATLGPEPMSCGRACQNGGNLDLNFLDQGSTIYLPVNLTKPLLLIGDLHISQGNGEAAGIAIEADGEITLKVDIVDKVDFPVIDHKNNMIIVGWGETIHDALKKSVENSILYLKRVFPFYDWSEEDLYKFISAEGNLVIGNSTGHIKTCGTVFLKKRLVNKFQLPVF